jgi:hypothetical chaperone protein
MSDFVYGLDFGTTNSAIAYLKDGNVEIIRHGEDGNKTMPSVLFFPEDSKSYLVGQEALVHYSQGFMDGRLMQSLKSTLPEKWLKGSQIRGKWYEIEDLIALIISHLKKKADNVTGENVKKVVLGRPAVFSQDNEKEQFAKERLMSAAKKAGFEEIHFQIEPIAAALFYEASLSQPEFVLVADFGGGTSDFTVMELSPDKIRERSRQADILGSKGVSIAGDKLDTAIMWHKLIKYFGANVKWSSWDSEQWLGIPVHVMRAICDWRQIVFLRERRQRKRITDIRYGAQASFRLTDQALEHLRDKGVPGKILEKLEILKDQYFKEQKLLDAVAEQLGRAQTVKYKKLILKHADTEAEKLIARLEALIDENLGFSLFKAIEKAKAGLSHREHERIEFQQSIIRISETIRRKEFEEMIVPEIEEIDECLEGFLADLGIAPTDIDSVFLTGGTAYVPRIRNLLQEKFGVDKIRQGDAFISVVSGLALSSRLFFEDYM